MSKINKQFFAFVEYYLWNFLKAKLPDFFFQIALRGNCEHFEKACVGND